MTITTTQLRRKVSLAGSATQGDILVTKRGRPFVVIMDATRYQELIDNQLTEEDMNETQYLKSSKKNKDRLDSAIEQLNRIDQ